MSLSNAFYDYARLSRNQELRLGYKGVDPVDGTVGYLAPEIVYPDLRTGLDVAGNMGGPELDGDNSLSYPGSGNDVAAPIVPDPTVPDHTLDSAVESLVDYTGVQPALQGETATVTVFVLSRYVDSSVVAKLVSGDITMEYHDGSTWQSATPVFGWEGGAAIEFDHDLPASSAGQIRIRNTFNSGNVVEADYEVYVKAELEGVKLFEVLETMEVSA